MTPHIPKLEFIRIKKVSCVATVVIIWLLRQDMTRESGGPYVNKAGQVDCNYSNQSMELIIRGCESLCKFLSTTNRGISIPDMELR
jgi:hypothetical protein